MILLALLISLYLLIVSGLIQDDIFQTDISTDHKDLQSIVVIDSIGGTSWNFIKESLCLKSVTGGKLQIIHSSCNSSSEAELKLLFDDTYCNYEAHSIFMLCPTIRIKYLPGTELSQHNYWKIIVQTLSDLKEDHLKDNNDDSQYGTNDIDILFNDMEKSQLMIHEHSEDNLNTELESIELKSIRTLYSMLPTHTRPYIINLLKPDSAAILNDALNAMYYSQLRIYNDKPKKLIHNEVSQLLLNKSKWAANQQSSIESSDCEISGKDNILHKELLQAFSKSSVSSNIDSNNNNNNNDDDDDKTDKILCITYTYGDGMPSADGIAATWGKQCDGYLAFTNQGLDREYAVSPEDLQFNLEHAAKIAKELGIGEPPVVPWLFEQYHDMWMKSLVILNTLASSELYDNYNYFLIGGDDLYVHIPRLRKLLNSSKIKTMQKSNIPLYLGRTGKQNRYINFNMGGAGYVINQQALNRLAQLIDYSNNDDHDDNNNSKMMKSYAWQQSFNPIINPCMVHLRTAMEDLLVGYCLKYAGVEALVPDETWYDNISNDNNNNNNNNEEIKHYKGKHIFHPHSLLDAWNTTNVIISRMMDGDKIIPQGEECCSSHSISFQDVHDPDDMKCIHSIIHQNKD